jgi:type I restriction enzyme M protein
LKGKPKNYLPPDELRAIAETYRKGEAIDGELVVIDLAQAKEADYNLSPSRWVGQSSTTEVGSISDLIKQLADMDKEAHALSLSITAMLSGVRDEPA